MFTLSTHQRTDGQTQWLIEVLLPKDKYYLCLLIDNQWPEPMKQYESVITFNVEVALSQKLDQRIMYLWLDTSIHKKYKCFTK